MRKRYELITDSSSLVTKSVAYESDVSEGV